MTPEELAWAWVAHLRAGGTTTWRAWTSGGAPETSATAATPAPTGSAPIRSGVAPRAGLPAAAQLEVLRRLAERSSGPRAPSSGSPRRRPDLEVLADRLLDRSGPGRGMADLPLLLPDDGTGSGAGSGVVAGRIGPRPIDPGDVPIDELLRTTLGLLADLLVEDPAAGRPPRRPGRSGPADLLRRRGPRYRVAGAPVSAADLTGRLIAAGRRPGGRTPTVMLLVPPLEVALAEVWSSRVQAGAPVRWRTFLDGCVRRGALPRGADAAAAAARWAGRVGPDQVHVLPVRAGASQGDGTTAAAAEVLGLPPAAVTGLARPPRLLDPRPLTPAATDLLRRLNRVLSVRVAPDRHQALVRHLVDRLPGPARGEPVAPPVPARHREWVSEQAARVADELRHGGYPVHGDPDAVARGGRPAGGPAGSHRETVEQIALEAVLDLAEDPGPRQREDTRR